MDGFLIVSFVPLKNAPQSRRNYQLPNHTQSSTVLREHKSSPRGQGELSKMDQIMEEKSLIWTQTALVAVNLTSEIAATPGYNYIC